MHSCIKRNLQSQFELRYLSMPVIGNILYLLLVIYWLGLGVASAQVDGTLIPGQNGTNVVIAVIEKIDASQVFDDTESQWYHDDGQRALVRRFLQLKAFVDTEYGKKPDGQGGIWNVTEVHFNETLSYVDGNQHLRSRISNSLLLQIDWLSVNYTDMSVPMYSGLATMLRLDQLLQTITSPLIESRLPSLWREHFGGEDEHIWRTKTNNLQQSCTIKSDVVFVLDASNSISERDLAEAKSMVYNFTDQLVTADGDNRIGIILIRTAAIVHLNLDKFGGLTERNKNSTLQRIDDIQYVPYHFTNTADGLCKMSQQPWRNNDSSVLKVAIVLTDGRSNHHSEECGGGTEHVVDYIHNNHTHILVFAVGIGDRISRDELLQIASRRHFATKLDQFEQLESYAYEESLLYQICYTAPSPVYQGDAARGRVKDGQIARWALDGVGSAGVTIRFCVSSGQLTLYVSHLPNPSEVLHDDQATIATTDKLAVDCSTHFENANSINSATSRKRRQVPQDSTTIYISIVGRDNNTVFSVYSESGNVTFDINECKQEPCDKSADCYNTDGSFYCECQEGFTGNGFKCTELTPDIVHIYKNNTLAVILPSTLLSVVITVLLIIVIVLLFLRRFQRCASAKFTTSKTTIPCTNPIAYESEIQFVRANLRKVSKIVSATNPLSMTDSVQEVNVE